MILFTGLDGWSLYNGYSCLEAKKIKQDIRSGLIEIVLVSGLPEYCRYKDIKMKTLLRQWSVCPLSSSTQRSQWVLHIYI